MKYFSAFSGIGGFEIPLEEQGFECVGYSEIDKYAIQIYQKHFPTHKNYGNITKIDIESLPDFDLLVGGSPCQDLSIAKNNRQGLSGSRSGLFYNYLKILRMKKPKYFILENVASMPKEARDIISKELTVEPVMINASLVSAQNRKRLFWANFPIIQPRDKGILLKDILENGNVDRLKSYCIDANYYKGTSLKHYLEKGVRQIVRIGQIGMSGQGNRIYGSKGKSVSLSANSGGIGAKTGLYVVENKSSAIPATYYKENVKSLIQRKKKGLMIGKNMIIRKLTPIECARLQCFPDSWCEGLSNTRQYMAFGNAVNVEVVRHIIKCLFYFKDVG